MLILQRSRWLPGIVTIVCAWLLSGCGGSSLKTSKKDAGLGGLGGGLSDSGQGSGGTSATGGTPASGGAVGSGGSTGQETGGVKTTGGATGTGGLTGKGGSAGTAAGGMTSTGGKTGTGGRIGTGGSSGTGGKTGGTSGNGGTGGGAAAALLQPLGNAFCTAAKSCCGLGSYPTAALADCESKFLSRFQFYPMVDKGTVTVDQSALAACLAAYNKAATACTVTPLYTACKGVFVGTKAEKQPCGSGNQLGSLECKLAGGSAACFWENSSTDPAVTGVCINITHGKDGDECSTSCAKNETCISDIFGGTASNPATCFEEDGLYCAWSKKPVVCRPIRQIDQACTSDQNACGSGNYCDWTTNTCQVIKKLGESCEDASCTNDLMCGTNLKCIEQPFASEFVCQGTPIYLY
jgi:hypothetical protein